MTILVVTGGDSKYADLMRDMFATVRHHHGAAYRLGMVDAGLTGEQAVAFRASGVEVVSAHLTVDYPNRASWEATAPGHLALCAKPHLRALFPGHDIYIWVDPDIWFQDGVALPAFVEGVRLSGCAIVPEIDSGFAHSLDGPPIWRLTHQWYTELFGAEIGDAMALRPLLNCGLVALAADAPHWQPWWQAYLDVLGRIAEPKNISFMAEMLSFNVATYRGKLGFTALPSRLNWLCHLALPTWNPALQRLCTPNPPYESLSTVHVSAHTKNSAQPIRELPGDATREMSLRFDATRF